MKHRIRRTFAAAIAVLLMLGSVTAWCADEKTAPAHPADQPGFDRPLVIDRKLEKDVKDLQKRVEALEKTVADIEKKLKAVPQK